MIEVAVIGAGTAGIVAARHLISAGLRPTIFEAAKTIGGAWTPSSSSAFSQPKNDNEHSTSTVYSARKMWDGMHTNLSKYTCQFTDWLWPEDASTFPSVEEMHRYLQSYSDNFLDHDNCDFQFECKVTNIEPLGIASEDIALQEGQTYYNVEWTDLKTQTRTSKDFGGVVIATGFFNTPRFPTFVKSYPKGIVHENIPDKSKPKVIHSSDYQTHTSYQKKNVAVIGSSFSALEIAADLSQSASRIVNVVPSVPWVLPRWVSILEPLQMTSEATKTDSSPDDAITVLPVDLAFYQRNQPFPQQEVVQLDQDSCQKRHQFLKSLAGHKQKHSPLGEPLNWSKPPFVAISDEYLDLIREGRIEVVHGRLDGIVDNGSLSISGSQIIEGIDVVICCTGYTPHLHDFLPPSILQKLDYDPDDTFSPLSLAWDVLHPSLPGLAFCGMVSYC
jgi:cation diffusion facilitator CzcD-associated flavoprotein CzcO